jgi:CRP-like cAMP-binding protein
VAARVVNRLIDNLPRQERSRIIARCHPVDLALGAVLCQPGEPFEHVYFPISGFISQVVKINGHQPLELSLIGNEGMLGATLALGVQAASASAVVQGAGTALRMTAAQLRRYLRDTPSLVLMLNRYLYVSIAQLSQSAGCTAFHEVEPRLARWLLMTHDRAHADHFHLTHEFLADMLGVRRSGITIAAGVLQRRKLIRYSRGEIRVLDRKGLEAASCECYGELIDDYTQLFG